MKFIVFALFLGLTTTALRAQTPIPIVVQAATPAAHAVPVAQAPAASNGAESAHAVEVLQQMEAANADLLKKQQATLAALDEMQKAVEELKIFSKRG